MIGYVTLGTNDFDRAAEFYDALLAELGGKRMMEDERFIAWSNGGPGAAFSIIKPFDEQEATCGNGTMIALAASDQDLVDKVYARALELGATSEGEPGPRGDGGFYAGYFRDLDGNKLNVFTMPGLTG